MGLGVRAIAWVGVRVKSRAALYNRNAIIYNHLRDAKHFQRSADNKLSCMYTLNNRYLI